MAFFYPKLRTLLYTIEVLIARNQYFNNPGQPEGTKPQQIVFSILFLEIPKNRFPWASIKQPRENMIQEEI